MIEITKFTAKEKGALRGYLSIAVAKWGGFQINDMAYFEMNGKRWINFPSREYLNKDGEKKYAAFNGFTTPEVKQKFQDAVIVALDEWLKKNGPQIQPLAEKRAEPESDMGELPF